MPKNNHEELREPFSDFESISMGYRMVYYLQFSDPLKIQNGSRKQLFKLEITVMALQAECQLYIGTVGDITDIRTVIFLPHFKDPSIQ
jgi:hypothetical protein